MNIEEIRDFCLAQKATTESFPFDKNTLVFKVLNKMFLLVDVEDTTFFNVKCKPDYALELREKHPAVQPGYHMNKKTWNSVYLDSSLSNDFLKELIIHSYNEVILSFDKKTKTQYESV